MARSKRKPASEADPDYWFWECAQCGRENASAGDVRLHGCLYCNKYHEHKAILAQVAFFGKTYQERRRVADEEARAAFEARFSGE